MLSLLFNMALSVPAVLHEAFMTPTPQKGPTDVDILSSKFDTMDYPILTMIDSKVHIIMRKLSDNSKPLYLVYLVPFRS